MTLADYAICGPAALPRERFGAILRDGGSPAAPEADSMYLALRNADVRPEVLLAFFFVESKFGTIGVAHDFNTHNPGNVRQPERATIARTIVQTPRGPFAKYPTWADGTADWAARLTGPKYAGAGLTTVRQVLPKYAPGGDSNDPDAYARTVLQKIAEWTGAKTMDKPAVTSRPSPNHGYPGAAYRPEAIVWHISQGSGASAVNWLANPASNASSNYVVVENGEIVELVNPEGGADGAAWANGDVKKPDLSNALIAGWVKAGVNPNLRTVSIEHAGMTSNNHGGSLTPAQVAATIRLTAWLCARFGIAPDQDHILGHYQINDVDRHYCPGFSAAEWSAWVGQVAALVGGAGAVAQPIGATKPPAPFQHAPGFLDPLVDSFDWQGAGIVTYRKIRAYNDQTGVLYQREWEASTGFTPWVEVK